MKISENIHLGTKKRFSRGAGLSDLRDLVFDLISLLIFMLFLGTPSKDVKDIP